MLDGMSLCMAVASTLVVAACQARSRDRCRLPHSDLAVADIPDFTASAAANLEYEMFDSMFGSLSPSFPLGDLGNTTDASTPTVWSNLGLPDPANASHPPSVNDFVIGNDPGLQQTLGADLSPTTMFPGTWSGGNDEMNAIPHVEPKPRKMTPEDVYRTILKPYDYTEGYHILMQYLTQK